LTFSFFFLLDYSPLFQRLPFGRGVLLPRPRLSRFLVFPADAWCSRFSCSALIDEPVVLGSVTFFPRRLRVAPFLPLSPKRIISFSMVLLDSAYGLFNILMLVTRSGFFPFSPSTLPRLCSELPVLLLRLLARFDATSSSFVSPIAYLNSLVCFLPVFPLSPP